MDCKQTLLIIEKTLFSPPSAILLHFDVKKSPIFVQKLKKGLPFLLEQQSISVKERTNVPKSMQEGTIETSYRHDKPEFTNPNQRYIFPLREKIFSPTQQKQICRSFL